MSEERKQYSAAFKARVALEAIKGQRTISELSSEHGVHPNQITKWKKQALEELPAIFSHKRLREERRNQELESELYKQIGQLKVELDWLKKNLDLGVEEKGKIIDVDHARIPVHRQCELLDLPRSSFYYKPTGPSQWELELMRRIDEPPHTKSGNSN
jgi:putative transposase